MLGLEATPRTLKKTNLEQMEDYISESKNKK